MLEAIFNPENPVFCLINKILDLVLLSLVWALCGMPVVTAGAASAALYYAVVKSVRRQRSYPVREFWRGFRMNLKKGILIQILWMVLAAMTLVSDVPLFLTFLDTGKLQDKVFLVLLILKVVFLQGMACWIYPLLSRFEERTGKLAEAALVLMIRHLPVTLAAVFLVLVTGLLLYIEPLLAAVIPGTGALLLSFLLEPHLRQLVRREETGEEEDPWYLERR